MPLLGFFRKDKVKENASKAVPAPPPHSLRPPQPRSGASNASNETATSSSTKLRMPLFGRRPQLDTLQSTPIAPPSKSRFAPNDPRNVSSRSLPTSTSQSLQREQTPRKPRPTSGKDAFTWGAARSRSKSRDPVPNEREGEFNLKSFRHVRAESPVNLPPPPSRTPPPGMRPRGNSTASDSSQKVTVAAFRQAQARRSSTNIDIPNGGSTSNLALTATPPRPPRGLPSNNSIPQLASPLMTPPASASSSKLPASSSSTPTMLPNQRRYTKSLARGSSSSSSSSSSDTDLERRRTITRQTYARAKSEIGHTSNAATTQVRSTSAQNLSAPVRRSSSIYVRQRASHSTSALGLSPAASHASLVAKGKTPVNRLPDSDSDEDESSEEESSDDAPLVRPPRPHSAMSKQSDSGRSTHTNATSRSRLPGRPLLDLSALSTENPSSIPLPEAASRGLLGSRAQPQMVGRRADGSTSPSPISPTSDRSDGVAPPRVIRTLPVQSSFAVTSRPPLSRRIGESASSLAPALNQKISRTEDKLLPPRSGSRAFSAPQTGSVGFPPPPSPERASRPMNNSQASLPFSSSSSRLPSASSSPQDRSRTLAPTRPYASPRRDSPASSTGDSSSGQAPITPRDGSDRGSAYIRTTSSGGLPTSAMARPGHAKRGSRGSVTFDDTSLRKGRDEERERELEAEQRRKERRQREARNALELGNVVNGPAPVPHDDDDMPLGLDPRMTMMNPNMQMGIFNMAPSMHSGYAPSQTPTMLGIPQQMPPTSQSFFPPTPTTPMDSSFLAAHAHAMQIAKQTYQLAVAQQALAAAGDEWERNSAAGGWGSSSTIGAPSGMMSMPSMFPPAPRSMYSGWGGGGSVYGAPAPSVFGSQSMLNLNTGSGGSPKVHPRSRVVSSNAPTQTLPQHSHGHQRAPSSWRQ